MSTENRPCVAVIGGANLDIHGQPFGDLRARDSCPGWVKFTSGGVGRNIAHNLCLLGVHTRLVAAFGEDSFRDVLLQQAHAVGMDTTLSQSFADAATSCYLFVSDNHGEMQTAVSAMEISKRITPDFLAQRMEEINRCDLCFADTNTSPEALEYLFRSCTVPIFCDPISIEKSVKLLPHLAHLHTVKPNRQQAEILAGISITNEADLDRAACILLDKGVQTVYISLGADGGFAANAAGERFRLPCLPTQLRNATGAGDCFSAAITYAYLHGYSLRESLLLGLAGGAIAAEGEETINPALSENALLQRANSAAPVSFKGT